MALEMDLIVKEAKKAIDKKTAILSMAQPARYEQYE